MRADRRDFPELRAGAEPQRFVAALNLPLPTAKGDKTKHLPSVTFDQRGVILLIPENESLI